MDHGSCHITFGGKKNNWVRKHASYQNVAVDAIVGCHNNERRHSRTRLMASGLLYFGPNCYSLKYFSRG